MLIWNFQNWFLISVLTILDNWHYLIYLSCMWKLLRLERTRYQEADIKELAIWPNHLSLRVWLNVIPGFVRISEFFSDLHFGRILKNHSTTSLVKITLLHCLFLGWDIKEYKGKIFQISQPGALWVITSFFVNQGLRHTMGIQG